MLIEVDVLRQRQLEGDDLRVFDCRFQLGQPDIGPNAYAAGHIPGALYLNLETDMAGPVRTHGGRHPLPDVIKLALHLGQRGVSRENPIVVYDAGEGMATRAWWLLRYMGHSDVSVLNGGLPAWVSAGLPVTSEIPTYPAANFHLDVQAAWLVDDVAAVEAISSGVTPGRLIDARAGERFRGEMEPIDFIGGHIPRAQNAPWTDGLEASGRWKSPEAQRARFESVLSTDASGPVVTYCGSGVTACANVFALSLAGISDVKLYNGSWSDWISYPEHPIAHGSSEKERIVPRK